MSPDMPDGLDIDSPAPCARWPACEADEAAHIAVQLPRWADSPPLPPRCEWPACAEDQR